jgi:hypothetical protein
MIRIEIDVLNDAIAQNETRVKNGLPELELKTRKCLRCNAEFESVGNRLCNECKKEIRDIY